MAALGWALTSSGSALSLSGSAVGAATLVGRGPAAAAIAYRRVITYPAYAWTPWVPVVAPDVPGTHSEPGTIGITRAVGYQALAFTPYAPLAAETIDIGKWQPQYPVRHVLVPNWTYLWRAVGGAGADDVAAFLPDKWLPQQSEPARYRHFPVALHQPLAHYATIAGLPAEAITLDKWWTQSLDPAQLRDMLAALTPSGVLPDAWWPAVQEVTPLSWWLQASEPIRRRAVERGYAYLSRVEFPGFLPVPPLAWEPAFPAWNARFRTYAWLHNPYDWGFDYTTVHEATIYMVYQVLLRRRRRQREQGASKWQHIR